MVEPYEDHGLVRELTVCPGDAPYSISFTGDQMYSSIMFLVGLGKTGGAGSPGDWYEGTPGDEDTYTVATQRIFKDPPRSCLLTSISGPTMVVRPSSSATMVAVVPTNCRCHWYRR